MASNEHRQVFGIIVRALGFFLTVYGFYSAFYAIIRLFQMNTRSNLPPSSAGAFAVFLLVIGVAILRKADWVVRFTYGPDLN